MVKRVAVAVVRRVAEDADVAVFVEPAKLAIVGDVAPDKVLALRVPGAAFGPAISGAEALDGRVADLVFIETLIERNDVGIGIAFRLRAGAVIVAQRGRRKAGSCRSSEKSA